MARGATGYGCVDARAAVREVEIGRDAAFDGGVGSKGCEAGGEVVGAEE